MRGLLLIILASALLTGCGAEAPRDQAPLPVATVPASASASAPPVAECTAEGLAFSLGGVDAAMGVRVMGIKIVNCGTATYTVEGYPDLRLFGADREPLAVAVVHGSRSVASVPSFDVPPTPVTLAPGESAWSGMVWRNLVTDPTVNATSGVFLDVAVSQAATWQQVPMVSPDESGETVPTTIDLGNTDTIGVGPWQRSRDEEAAPPVSTRPSTDDEARP